MRHYYRYTYQTARGLLLLKLTFDPNAILFFGTCHGVDELIKQLDCVCARVCTYVCVHVYVCISGGSCACGVYVGVSVCQTCTLYPHTQTHRQK